MAYSSTTGVSAPQRTDEATGLLYKIGWVLWAVANGDIGFLVRGRVTAAPAQGATVATTAITSGLTSNQLLVAANLTRVYVTIDNRTGADLFYSYGTPATTAVGGYSMRIPAGAPPVTDSGYAGAINFICGAGATTPGVSVTDVSV